MAADLQWLRNLFLRDKGLKALSLVLAVLCYYALRGAINFEVSYEVPLEVQVEKGIAILDRDADAVLVTFRGSQQDTALIAQNQLKAVIHPQASTPDGYERVAIHPRDIQGASPGVRVVRIWPGHVTVAFDHEEEKVVQISKPKTVGRPLAGRVELDYEPRFVTIRGPKRRLDLISSVATEPVDVDGRIASFSKRVRVLPEAPLSAANPPEITVKVAIIAEIASRTWTNVAVRAFREPGVPGAARVEPAAVNVVLHGAAESIEGTPRDAVRVFVDCAGLDPVSSYELPVRVYLPEGRDLTATAEPETVRVTFGGP